jgi:hypothetical protein
MWATNAGILATTFFYPLSLGLFALMLLPSTILSVKLQPGVGRDGYLYTCWLAALVLLGAVVWGVMQPATRFGEPRLEVFVLGLFGLPPLVGWVSGWALGRFVRLGLHAPESAQAS